MAGKNGINANVDEKVDEQLKATEGEADEKSTDPEKPEGDGSNPDGAGDGASGKEPRTFTQEEVNKMMAREKQQGRNSVYNDLGINPKDARLVKMVKSFIGSQAEAADPQEVDQALAEAQHRADVMEAKVKAMEAGVKPQFVDDIIVLVTAKLESEEGSDFDTLIAEMKSKYKDWFVASGESEGGSVGVKGTGSSVNLKQAGNSGSSDSGEQSLGKRLAASRSNSKIKKSYYFSK